MEVYHIKDCFKKILLIFKLNIQNEYKHKDFDFGYASRVFLDKSLMQ